MMATSEPVFFSASGKQFEGKIYSGRRGHEQDGRPVILLLPDWRGQHATYADRRALELAHATSGTVFLSDLFGTQYRPVAYQGDAEHWISHHLADPCALRHQLSGFVRAAADVAGVPLTRIVIVGYCLGGALALEAARSDLPVASAISVHGIPSTKIPVERLDNSTIMLAIHGGSDPIIGSDHLRSFEAEMTRASAHWRLLVLGHARHGFTDEDQPSNGQFMRYDRQAHKQSTAAIVSICSEVALP